MKNLLTFLFLLFSVVVFAQPVRTTITDDGVNVTISTPVNTRVVPICDFHWTFVDGQLQMWIEGRNELIPGGRLGNFTINGATTQGTKLAALGAISDQCNTGGGLDSLYYGGTLLDSGDTIPVGGAASNDSLVAHRTDINNLQTLSGRPDGSTHLGTMSQGTQYPDNLTIKVFADSTDAKLTRMGDGGTLSGHILYGLGWGQSNMVGTGTGGDTLSDSRIQVFRSGGWKTAYLNSAPFVGGNRNNLLFHHAKNWIANNPLDTVRLTIVAVSGRSITYWTPANDSIFQLTLTAVSTQGVAHFDWIDWMQGEQDQAETDDWYTLKWDTVYQRTMAQSWADSTTKISVIGLFNESGKTTALKTIGGGKYINVNYVSPTGLSSIGDLVHYTGGSLVVLGRRCYESCLSLPQSWRLGRANSLYYADENGKLKTSGLIKLEENSSPIRLRMYNSSNVEKWQVASTDGVQYQRKGLYIHDATTLNAPGAPAGVGIWLNNGDNFNMRYQGSTAFLLENKSDGADVIKMSTTGSGGRLSIYQGSAGSGQFLQVNSTTTDNGDYFKIDNNGLVSINNSTVDTKAQLSITSTTRGFLPPRMTITQRNAISGPGTGLQVFQTTTNKPSWYNGSSWRVPVDSTTAEATYLKLTGGTLSGNLFLPAAVLSNTISLEDSGAASTAGNVTLVGGTATVSTTAATSTCLVFLQRKTAGGTIGFSTTYTVSAGTSFTVTSDNALDTSTFSWMIVETH